MKFIEYKQNILFFHSLRQIKRKKSNAYPIELKKTGVALIFMVINFCATTISLALTHERTPDKDPLPDFLLDNIQNRVWGLTASEIVLQVLNQFLTKSLHLKVVKFILSYIYIYLCLPYFIYIDKRNICNDCPDYA